MHILPIFHAAINFRKD